MPGKIDPANLFATSNTETVLLFPPSPDHPKGIWVTFKTGLSYGERTDLQAALFKGMSLDEAEAASKSPRSTVYTDIGRQRKLSLATWITDWNFPGPDGKTVRWPSTLAERIAVIEGLGEPVGDWLEEQVKRIAGEDALVGSADPDDDAAVNADPLAPRLAVVGPAPTP